MTSQRSIGAPMLGLSAFSLVCDRRIRLFTSESAMRLACSADGRWASSDRQTGFIMNGCRLEPSPWITPIARAPTCARSWWPWAFI